MSLQVDREHYWTYEDSLTLPDDGRRYEIIDGVLYVSPSPRTWHQTLSRRLQFFFYQFEVAGQGYVFDAPMDLLMPGCTPVQPDLIFLTRDQKPMIEEKAIVGVPHLLVEILSPGTRSLDRVKKLNRYAQNAVPFYLIVDPDAACMEVLIFGTKDYHVLALSEEDEWEFLGRKLDLAALFAPLI